MKWNKQLIVIMVLAVLALLPAATPRAAAQGPALLLTAPAHVAAGARLTLVLTLQNAADLGGYQANLRFDPTAAHFNGMEQDLGALRLAGRDVEPLGPVDI